MECGSSSKERCDITEDDHNRCIVHIDIDCFYAQVEMVRNPELRDRPLGIQQKNIVVTSNYLARDRGVTKCMLVTEAMRVCPELVLVRGEDLQHYRKMSQEVHAILKTWGGPVERLGMDENYIDVSECVSRAPDLQEFKGHVWGDRESDLCRCSCSSNLRKASHIAQEMRTKLKDQLGITTCAGIGHNKLIAKLATGLHKPNQQTTVPPWAARALLASLPSPRHIPGVGAKTADTLSTLGLNTVAQLQECPMAVLRNTFSGDVAGKLRSLSLGSDRGDVKMSGRASSLGLEDSFKVVSVESEVRERFLALLKRLLVLLGGEVGTRRPGGLRLTLRHHAPPRTPSRTTRHITLPPSLFRCEGGTLHVTEEGTHKMMELIMRLFRKLVDLGKPFHLTLIGLAFTKFQDIAAGRNSIAGYLMNSDVSVQTVMDLENDAEWSNSSMDCSLDDRGGLDRGGVEVEPSPKKLCVGELRLAHLRLSAPSPPPPAPPSPPPHVDRQVFEELPTEVQQELRATWTCAAAPPRPPSLCLDSPLAKGGNNTITRYFIPNKLNK